MAHISFILSNEVNKMDFKVSESFLEKIMVVSNKIKLKAIKDEFNRIW